MYGSDKLDVLVVDDQRARPGRLEDVGDARAPRRVVDRDLDRADAEDPEPREQELCARGHHHGDAVAPLDPQLSQPGRDPAGSFREPGVRDGLAVDDRQRLRAAALGLLLGVRGEVHGRTLCQRVGNLKIPIIHSLESM